MISIADRLLQPSASHVVSLFVDCSKRSQVAKDAKMPNTKQIEAIFLVIVYRVVLWCVTRVMSRVIARPRSKGPALPTVDRLPSPALKYGLCCKYFMLRKFHLK